MNPAAPTYRFEHLSNPTASQYCRDLAAYMIGRQFLALNGERPGISRREIALHEAGHALALSAFGGNIDVVRITSEQSGYCLPAPIERPESEVSTTGLPGVIENLCVLAAGYVGHRLSSRCVVELALMGAAHELSVVAYGCLYAQTHWHIPSLSALRATIETCEAVMDSGQMFLHDIALRLEAKGEVRTTEIGECLKGMPEVDARALWLERAAQSESRPIGTGQHGELEQLLSAAIGVANAIRANSDEAAA